MEIAKPAPLPLGFRDSKDSIPGDTKDEGILCTQQSENGGVDTINDLLLKRIRDHPDSTFVSYPASTHGKSDYVDYTASRIDEFADEAARRYAAKGVLPDHPTSPEAEVVALLAPSSLDYIVSIFALSRMGFAILFLSNRLANDAFVNLLEKTKCKKLVVSSQNARIAEQIQTQYAVSVSGMVEQSEYQLDTLGTKPRFPVVKWPGASKRVSFIIHSSGSTGLPKPIFQTHAACLANYSSGIPYRAFLTLPLFHNHGISTLFRALVAGKKIALYNSSIPLSGSALADAMEAVQPESLHCVPYALKLMAESERGIEVLKRCKLVLFGGSSCPDDLGDKLVNAGVYLVGHYGATEMGQLMTSFREADDKAWNYMRPLASVKPFLKMVPVGNGAFELVVLDGLPSKVMSNSDDPPNSFYTKDTFAPHPTMPDAWKYLGRLDDRVTLVNGEKVLPVPYEHRIRQNELVQEAVVFGVDRAVPGLIVIPSEHAKGISREDMLKKIMPDIEEANAKAESFGRIFPEMVEILEHGTEYPRTDKGTVIRAAFYKVFAQLINDIYSRFEAPTQDGDRKVLLRLSSQELQQYLLELFRTTLGRSLDLTTDFFDAGLDSLQAITARARLMREMDLGGKILGQNVVFEYPNISLLSRHILSLSSGEDAQKDDEIALMRELIDKYSQFNPRTPGTIQPDGQTVILTGATGSLGAHILGQMVVKHDVKRVWCLVRASSPLAAQIRVLSTLESKGISELGADHLAKISCLPADLSQPTLGLEENAMNELKTTLTTVIHAAWAVNFNLGVRSFESHHIRGTYNLLNFCLATETVEPAKLFFCSSISAAAGTPIPATVPETYIKNLEHAQPMGYARSKVVTEHIVKAAREKTGMVARVLRLGQIIGDTDHGMWNTTEAIPLMLQSVYTLKALPALDETPSWMPVDLMAKSCIELAGLAGSTLKIGSSHNETQFPEDDNVVYQVQNHILFHWTHDLLPALQRAGLDFKIVNQREWVRLLRKSQSDPLKNPTFKLLSFFTEKYDNDRPGREGLVFDTTKTAEKSETVRDGYDVVGSGLVDRMVEWWKTRW